MTTNLTKKRIFSEGDVTFYKTSSGIVCEIEYVTSSDGEEFNAHERIPFSDERVQELVRVLAVYLIRRQDDDQDSRTIAACARRFAGSAAPPYGGWTTVPGERKTDESDKDYSN